MIATVMSGCPVVWTALSHLLRESTLTLTPSGMFRSHRYDSNWSAVSFSDTNATCELSIACSAWGLVGLSSAFPRPVQHLARRENIARHHRDSSTHNTLIGTVEVTVTDEFLDS